MRDIPIMFSAPMVLALLAGRKTMTRRLAWRKLFHSPWRKVESGDRLWVKEAFVHYREKCKDSSTGFVDWDHYRATDEDDFLPGMKWKPSIFMPRALSRLTLLVTATKIERLRDISEADALCEGVERLCPGYRDYGNQGTPISTARVSFITLWDSLHGEDSWNRDNPEVVAMTFTVHKCNIDKMEKSEAA